MGTDRPSTSADFLHHLTGTGAGVVAAKGAYSVIVYILGGNIIAEDFQGNVISSGKAGINDTVVIQAAINYAGTLNPPGKVVLKGNFSIKTGIFGANGIWLEGGQITATTDINMLSLPDIYSMTVSDLILNMAAGATKAAIYLTANATHNLYNRFNNIGIYGTANTGVGIYLYAVTTTGKGVTSNYFNDIVIWHIGSAIKLDCASSDATNGGWVYSNVFNNIDIWDMIIGIEFARDGTTPDYGYSHNVFSDVFMEASAASKFGVKNRKGDGNMFSEVCPWDFYHTTGGVTCSIEAGKETNATVFNSYLFAPYYPIDVVGDIKLTGNLHRGSNTITYGTAAPKTGTWARGDICYNATPSAGGTPGWVCTTGGTPGMWKAMANLAL